MSIKKFKTLINDSKKPATNIYTKVKKAFKKVTDGNESYNKLLWLWGILPIVLVIFYVQEVLEHLKFKIITTPVWMVIILYFIWHIVAINTTIKKHPEYRKKAKAKKDYSKMSKAKAKELKLKERKAKNIERLQKLLLLKPWDGMEFYKIVILMDFFVILIGLQNILF